MPGLVTDLSQRLADVGAALADEEGKLEKSAQRARRLNEMHQRGQIDVFGIAARLAADTDEGDAKRAEQRRRRRDNLRQQLGEAAAMITPQRDTPADPVEAAASRARAAGHEAYLEATRARLAGAPQPRERRPFVFRGSAGGPYCAECATAGASRSESAKIHAGGITRVFPADGGGVLGTLAEEITR